MGNITISKRITLMVIISIVALLLVGATGYGTALLFLLHGGPDLALTQVLVETVALIVFVMVLRRLPKYFTTRPLGSMRW